MPVTETSCELPDEAGDRGLLSSNRRNRFFSSLSFRITCNGNTGYYIPVNTACSTNAGTMLHQRRRRWYNIVQALDQCFVYTERSMRSTQSYQPWSKPTGNVSETAQQTRDINPMLAQCWPNVCDAGLTSYQHWVNVSCLLGSNVM